jgi:hypothetical protein
MESKLSHLSLNPSPSNNVSGQKSKGKVAVADAWDEESLSDSDNETQDLSGPRKSTMPDAPPPTPISPSALPPWGSGPGIQGGGYLSASGRDQGGEERRRPEKSNAVAGRMIAAGLGVKVPKRTEEQRAYDRAVKEQEIKRRNREKAVEEKQKEEAERAKRAIWDG